MADAPAGYSATQKTFHWLVAAGVLCLVPAGIIMVNLPDGDLKNRVYELHKSFGLTVLALVLARVLVRLSRGAPELEPGLPGWQRTAANASHIALYVLIVLVPLLGWAGTSACCAPVQPFGLFSLTLPIGGGMERGEAILGVHKATALLLAALVLIHIAAALHHHLVRRDRTLIRMLPGGSGEREKVGMPDHAGRA